MSALVTARYSRASRNGCSHSLNGKGEEPFWSGIGAVWRQLAGNMSDAGFSFEWHEWNGGASVNWANSFHPDSVEICLNLSGTGWVSASGEKLEFGPDTAGFFADADQQLRACREQNQLHRFLSVEFSLDFLAQNLANEPQSLHRVVRSCLAGPKTGVSEPTPITSRHRELLRSLLHPPVLSSAQRLWYKSKALEFASEFFFVAQGEEPICTRAKRVAQERVGRVKTILLSNLENTPGLEELGKLAGCSPFYLSRTFTQETGITISQWLRRARLERAAELLQEGKANVTEAALQVGYSSLSHFSQAFHEAFGCCPGLYPLRTSAQTAPKNGKIGTGE